MRTAKVPLLLQLAAAADRCQLAELRVTCIRELARRLASAPSGLAGAIADASILRQHCSAEELDLVMGLLADAASASSLATPSVTVDALQHAPIFGSFEWTLERFLGQPSAVGERLLSPWFSAGGKEWRFQVFPGGATQEATGHLGGAPPLCIWL